MTGAPLGAAGFHGYAVLDKPVGVTSRTFLASMGRRLGPGVKSGHAGTLDSFASGVLICLFGRYTRLSDYFMCASKGYDADVLLGEETDTLDPSGKVVGTASPPSLETLIAALPAFRGDILQAPPAYSSVHIDGRRAYELALRGEAVEPKARPVSITSLELLSYDGRLARLRVACSKGTYIRSLARDLGLASGSRGRLEALRRTFSGPFAASEAVSPEAFGTGALRLLEPEQVQGLGLRVITLGPEESLAFRKGLPLYRLASFASAPQRALENVAAFDEEGTLLGIAQGRGDGWRYAFVLGGLG